MPFQAGRLPPLLYQGGIYMIHVTRINNSRLVINADWIETVEATPDTVITLTNGKKYVVAETVEDIINRVIEYKQKTFILNRTINTSPINDDK
jgi:flagellar protein FlbD